ncbi:MAG: UDP-3-O-(3-hydroxymyristoyl)glucosamine N-acyltransferase [Alphaproteobacteria bacterium]
MVTTLTLTELAQGLGVMVTHELGALKLVGVRPLDVAGPEHVSFLDNPKYKEQAQATKAGVMLVRPEDVHLVPATCVALATANPYAALAKVLGLFHPVAEVVAGVSAQAVVSGSARVDPTARIEPGAVVYGGAVIGPRVHVGAHTVVGENVVIGAGTRIAPHVTLLKCRVGERCIIHSGVRVGQDGFGFAPSEKGLVKVPQVGGVVIGNDVELGANTTVDCGALGDTVLEDGVKLDNSVQIAHNVRIGKFTVIAAQTGIAGSTRIGAGCMIGGQVGVAGHIALADRVQVAARSGVTKSIAEVGAVWAGMPAEPMADWRRRMAAMARLGKKKGVGDADA